MFHRWAWLVPTIAFGGAAVAKTLTGSLPQYLFETRLFPLGWIPFVVILVISAELATAVLCALPLTRRVGWYVTAGLGTAFAVYHGSLLALGDVLGCPCYGVVLGWGACWQHALWGGLSAGLTALGFWAVCKKNRVRSMRETSSGYVGPMGETV